MIESFRNACRSTVIALAACALSAGLASAMAPASDLIGRMMPDFSLPSQQDKLVVYEDDYYGKHHLILTFFPAAFTPV